MWCYLHCPAGPNNLHCVSSNKWGGGVLSIQLCTHFATCWPCCTLSVVQQDLVELTGGSEHGSSAGSSGSAEHLKPQLESLLSSSHTANSITDGIRQPMQILPGLAHLVLSPGARHRFEPSKQPL